MLNPTQMSPDEIKALEQRLADAGCYKGAIDGRLSGTLDASIKVCPDQRPVLRVETGMHTAQITNIGVDAACSLLATAADDKSVDSSRGAAVGKGGSPRVNWQRLRPQCARSDRP